MSGHVSHSGKPLYNYQTHLRCLLSAVLYWIGDAACKVTYWRIFNRDEDMWYSWVGSKMASLYQWAMNKSCDLDTGTCSIWHQPDQELFGAMLAAAVVEVHATEPDLSVPDTRPRLGFVKGWDEDGNEVQIPIPVYDPVTTPCNRQPSMIWGFLGMLLFTVVAGLIIIAFTLGVLALWMRGR